MRIYFLIITCLVSFMHVCGQSKEFTLAYEVNDFNYNTHGNLTYLSSKKINTFYKSKPFEPALPFTIVKILIGMDQEIESYSYTHTERLVKTRVVLANNPTAIPTNSSLSTTTANVPHINYPIISYPNELISYQGCHTIDGYKYLCFCVSPFRYNAQLQDLYLNTYHLQIQLSTSERRSHTTIGKNLRNMVMQNMQNKEDFNIIYPKSTPPQIVGSIADSGVYEYLIITSSTLKSSFESLAEWKTKRGIRAKVLTVEDIYQSYPLTQTYLRHTQHTLKCMKIKSAIKDYYINHGVKYVLLGGDDNRVPSLRCRIHGPYLPEILQDYESETPADYYYSALYDIDWDYDDDGNNNTSTHLFPISFDPDIVVSRISVDTPNEAENYINRLIMYEQEGLDSDGEWMNILMCGDTLYYVHNGQIDAEYLADTVYSTFIQPYSGIIRNKYFNVYNSLNQYLVGMCANNLQLALEDSHYFIDINTHGSAYSYTTGQDFYTRTHASNFTNPVKSFITTASCLTNDFSVSEPCLSETLMRNPNSGIMGYLGCSQHGWTYKSPYQIGSSERYSAEFYKLLFDNTNVGVHFGELALAAKLFLLEALDSLPEAECLLLGINPLGDPEMMVLQNTGLSEFSNGNGNWPVTIDYEDSILTVHAPFEGCRIAVFSKHDNGESYFAVSEGPSSASFIPPLTPCTISVTAYEFKPFFLDINAPFYVQNEIFNGNHLLKGDKAYIGRNVTMTKPEGAVIVQSGNTKIRVANSVTIKNSFEVKTGASFCIEVKN